MTFARIHPPTTAFREVKMKTLLLDLRYGLRMLLKAPGVSALAIMAMALGIGANTAIFSVIDAVLIRPLPYPESEELVLAGIKQPGDNSEAHPLGDADFLAWQERQTRFESVAACDPYNNFSLTGHGLPERLRGTRVTPDFFKTLGVIPFLGRAFGADEGRPGAAPTVIVSQNFWRGHLDSDPNAVGQSITLNGSPYTIVGVMPAGFQFPRRNRNDVWTVKTFATPSARPPYYLIAFGRLKPGVTAGQAQAELATIASQVTRQFPVSPFETTRIAPLKDFVVGNTRVPLLVLSGAVCLVFLIALANVANLLLARATARQREMAVRRALGAGGARLVRQLLTESVLLASLGGVGGLLIAKWCVDALVAFGPGYIPRLAEVEINVRVLFFTATLSVLGGIMLGLVPALSGFSSTLIDTLKGGSRTTSTPAGQRVRRWLVISEFALALMLLVGAGLLLQSLARLQRVDPGFDAGHLLTMNIALPQTGYAEEGQMEQFWQQFLERLQQLPGVKAAAITLSLPPNRLLITNPFTVESQGFDPSRPQQLAEEMSISQDYFRTLGVPLVKGRFFTEQDRGDSHVVIINQEMAKRYFPRQDPIGQRLQTGDADPKGAWETIVGVVGDVKYSGLASPAAPQIYVPFNSAGWIGWSRSMHVAIRTTGDPASFIPAVREAMGSLDRDIPLADIASMDQLLDESVAEQRFRTWLLSSYAGLALLLASIGIYAVTSYSVGQQIGEFGLRMALGAGPQDILRLVLGQTARLAAIGLLIGVAGALALARTMSSLLFSVSASDPATLLVACLVLVAVALLASVTPARRASKVSPLVALRYE
jgi:putative ABC transport system permease protein